MTTTPAPGSDVTATVLARAACEQVCALARVTVHGDGFATAAEVDALLGDLSILLDRLPHALRAATAWLVHADEAAWLGHDRHGQDTQGAVTTAGAALVYAGRLVSTASRCVDDARQDTAHLTTHTATARSPR